MKVLACIAKTEPQCALAAYTHGFRSKLTYLIRTIPNITNELQPLEEVIRSHFIPTILEGHQCNDIERSLLSLPPRFGGLGIVNPTEICDQEYNNSRAITKQLTSAVIAQSKSFKEDKRSTSKLKQQLKKAKTDKHQQTFESIKASSTDQKKLKALEASTEPGAYNWLTVLPLERYKFYLDKRTFWDNIRIRYNLPLPKMPEKCVCSASYDVEHALNCKKGGFISNRHNEVRNLTASILQEVCNDVQIEPILEPLSGEKLSKSIVTDNARVDIAARSVWAKGQRAYLDVRVFNPFAQRYLSRTLRSAYETNEKEKKRDYNERVLQIQHGSFTPLVFSCFGGMGRECKSFYDRIAELMAIKRDVSKSESVSWLRCRLNFSLIRSMSLCLRGSRSPYFNKNQSLNIAEVDITLQSVESKLD